MGISYYLLIIFGLPLTYYKGAIKNSPDSLVKHKSQITNVTWEMIANFCRNGVVMIGETKLGIRRSEIGTRSIRSGAAMALYLAGVPVFSIMLVGRWSSTAFLKYIRKQVQEFLQGISSKMIEVQSFVFRPRPKPNRNESDGEHS